MIPMAFSRRWIWYVVIVATALHRGRGNHDENEDSGVAGQHARIVNYSKGIRLVFNTIFKCLKSRRNVDIMASRRRFERSLICFQKMGHPVGLGYYYRLLELGEVELQANKDGCRKKRSRS